jgi:hypothetical protein
MTPDMQAALGTYLGLLDQALPGLVSGVYLTGSAALGDWQPGRSDLDILTVLKRPLSDDELDALEALHAKASERPYLDAVYVPVSSLGAADGPAFASAVDGVFARARHEPEPVLWATLRRHGVTVRGPAASALGVEPDPWWLREWNLGNLRSYWSRWAAGVRGVLAERPPDAPAHPKSVEWGASGPGRLHRTIVTGEIISKTASADYTASLFPAHEELLRRAKAWRLGDDTASFTSAEGLAICDLADAVVADAGRHVASGGQA